MSRLFWQPIIVASTLTRRLASADDLEALKALMDMAIGKHQKAFLTDVEIASGRTIMGLDTQLIDGGTHTVVEAEGHVAGFDGGSGSTTLYGGGLSPGRNAQMLDPKSDAARVQAIYTHPAFPWRGIGRLVLLSCQYAARRERFTRVELTAEAAGEPLCRARAYEQIERTSDDRGGAPVPLLPMGKSRQAGSELELRALIPGRLRHDIIMPAIRAQESAAPISAARGSNQEGPGWGMTSAGPSRAARSDCWP